MKSKISVVIPVYNVEAYIDECVKSVLAQDYIFVEIILVDDGSTDDSGKICDDLADRYEQIKVIHKQNGGLSSARNVGIKASTGDYLFFVDSDDYLAKGMLSALISELENNDADISIGGMERTSSRLLGTSFINDDYDVDILSSDDALLEMLYAKKYSTSACGKVFKSSLFEDVEFPDGKFSEDLFTIYKTILKSKKVVYLNIVGYYYYYRTEGSIVVSKYSQKQLEAIEAVDSIKKAIIQEGKANKSFMDALANMYYIVIYDIAMRRPSIEDFLDEHIIDAIIDNRKCEIRNRKASMRLRIFAVLTYVGYGFAIQSVFVYNYLKWKISRN